MREKIENLAALVEAKLAEASDFEALEKIRIEYLGKKGALTALLKEMGSLPAEERPKVGQLVNEVKQKLEAELEQRKAALAAAALEKKLKDEKVDVTLPAKQHKVGHLHPMTVVRKQLEEIFMNMGFSVVDGPEVELDYYNFEALNVPKDHPARDTQDTFYISDNVVLRTQTSPMQIRAMQNKKPPIKIIAPGKVYRSDALDATHSPVFHQVEGLVVDKGITFADLKGTLEEFARQIYGSDIGFRYRPHHFPFTEPSAEMDITCWACHGKGCKVCKGEGYIEILGAGMVHPKVLLECGIDPEVYSGFAFGMGLERLVMGRYSIDDLRLFTENDVRFLEQF